MTYAGAGLTIAVGKNLPVVIPRESGDIPVKFMSAVNTSTEQPVKSVDSSCIFQWLRCTAFASVEARLVARNVFLDGGMFREDPHVTKLKRNECKVVHHHLKSSLEKGVDRRRTCECKRVCDKGNRLSHSSLQFFDDPCRHSDLVYPANSMLLYWLSGERTKSTSRYLLQMEQFIRYACDVHPN